MHGSDEKLQQDLRRMSSRSMNNGLWRGMVAILAIFCVSDRLHAIQPKIVVVAAGVYALLGTGGEITPGNSGRTANVAFIVGPQGVIVVDSGVSYREGTDIIEAVQRVSKQPIRLLVLTHPAQEVIFGAAAFQDRGIPVLAHRSSAQLIEERCATCLGHLQSILGDEMAETRVVTPDRLLDGSQTLDLIGRRLRLVAPPWSSAPGAIAVFDEKTSTLIAGNMVSINRVPDIRDADPKAWQNALVHLTAMQCRHLVPGYGPIGSCADIGAFARYLRQLERRVDALVKEGVSLGELRDRCDLPEFARWDQYETLHPQNSHRTYIRLESSQFK
jgi:glyoxylase-like metal-dependent hydrolase (beta-lactamase superfamily II)